MRNVNLRCPRCKGHKTTFTKISKSLCAVVRCHECQWYNAAADFPTVGQKVVPLNESVLLCPNCHEGGVYVLQVDNTVVVEFKVVYCTNCGYKGGG